jgi:transposase-like protein
MARRGHTPEQVSRRLREADRLLAEGAGVADVARHLEISEPTYHRWRARLWRDEGGGRQAAEGAGGRARPAEADRGR